MTALRNALESWFETLSEWLYDNRLKVMVAVFLFFGLLVSRIPSLTVDTSTEGFLHETDPALKIYEEFRDQFGRDEMIIVALNPPSVFDPDFLKRLKALHVDLKENLPYLEDITSLINARSTRGKGDELIVEDLFETWPTTREELETIRKRASGNVMYRDMLLSRDEAFTTLIIQTHAYADIAKPEESLDDFSDSDFSDDNPAAGKPGIQASSDTPRRYLTDAQNSEIIRAVETIVANHPFPGTRTYVAGSPVVTDFLKRTMLSDMKKFMKIVVLTIALFLFLMFRRISGIVIPILVVIVSLASTVGLMAWTGTPLKLPTQILPSFILAVGVGDSVHILVMFFQHFNRSGDKRRAMSHALGHSGLAVLMTSLTTAGGLLSFSTASVAPIADLGRFAAGGVLMALVYTMVMLPAFISLVPLKPKYPKEKKTGQPVADRILDNVARLSTAYPGRVLIIAAVIIAVSMVGASRIVISHNPMKWLPDTNRARVANEIIDAELKGSTSLEVMLDTDRDNGFYDPDILGRLETAVQTFDTYHSEQVSAGKAWTLTTVLKETNQALHENNPAHYRVPQDRTLVAQELFLFENSGSDDLEDFTDSRFSKVRFTIKVPFIDAVAYTDFIDAVETYFTKAFPEAKVKMSGMVTLFSRVISNALFSMAKSYLYAMVVITLLMILLIGNIRIGVLSMIPNLAPIIAMLGIMGWTQIPMDLFCMLVGSIAIGLAVDDTIHFMHNFRRYMDETGSVETAVRETLHTTGRAMLVTTCVLSIGFFTFMFANMKNLFNFGLLTGLTIAMALAADYFIAPALMVVAHRRPAPDSGGNNA